MSRLVPEGADDPRLSGLLREARPEASKLGLVSAQSRGSDRYSTAQALLDAVDRLKPDTPLRLSVAVGNFGASDAEVKEVLSQGVKDRVLESFDFEASGGDREAAFEGQELMNFKAVEARLRVRDCTLRDASIGILTLLGFGVVRLENCTIGRLIISGNGAPDITVSGGRILVIDVEEKLDLRSLELSGVQISKHPMKTAKAPKDLPVWLRLDAVSFRRLHKWAQDKEDAKLAHQMRGHQLSVDYYLADGPEKPLLRLWWLFGNYGLSLWRPLLWLLLAFAVFVNLLLWSGSVAGIDPTPAVATSSTAGQLSDGWRSVLVGDEVGARLARAIVGATESIFSPVNVFSTRKLVVPSEPWVAVFQFFYSYFCLGMIFLFGFSIRRRFKI